MDTYKYYARTA